jgi:hypothetical protein
MDPFAVFGADQLDLKMVVIAQTLFDEHPAIAKLAFGVVLQLAIDAAEALDLGDLLDTHAAAAGRRLDQHRGLVDAFLPL